jgi:hypothetical protein
MNFNPNWNTDAKFHHLASQTYLKGWKHGDSSVYYIEKNDVSINGNWNRNTKKLAGIENFFSKKAGIFSQTLSDCEKYFKPLKGYKVEFHDRILKDSLEMNNFFNSYDEWNIYDSNSKIVSKEEKEKFKSQINNIHIKNIEVGWDRLYENNWPNVQNDILNAVSSNKGALKIPSVKREELVNFMVSLEWRTKPTHPILQDTYEKIVLSLGIEKFLKISIPEHQRIYPFIDSDNEFWVHSILLRYYYEFLNNNGPIYIEAQEIIKKMNINLLIAENGSEFITSDNPVCRFLNSDDAIEYIFPITPKVACAVRRGNPYDGSNYYLNYLEKDKVFNYNQKLKNNSYKGYILRQPSLSYYFK